MLNVMFYSHYLKNILLSEYFSMYPLTGIFSYLRLTLYGFIFEFYSVFVFVSYEFQFIIYKIAECNMSFGFMCANCFIYCHHLGIKIARPMIVPVP